MSSETSDEPLENPERYPPQGKVKYQAIAVKKGAISWLSMIMISESSALGQQD